jgi:hypothetical protein
LGHIFFPPVVPGNSREVFFWLICLVRRLFSCSLI